MFLSMSKDRARGQWLLILPRNVNYQGRDWLADWVPEALDARKRMRTNSRWVK